MMHIFIYLLALEKNSYQLGTQTKQALPPPMWLESPYSKGV